MMQSAEGFKPKICFSVDANGRTVWTGADAGGAKPAAEKKEAAPVVASGDHMLSSLENTEAFLSKHGIKFKTLRHEVTPTNEIMKQVVKFDGEFAETVLAKQLFLHDKKKKDNMWLVCAGVDTTIDMKLLSKHLKVGSGNLRAADPESLEKYLGCRKGLVNYFATMNDTEKKVTVLMDSVLMNAAFSSFHPMDNTGSTAIDAAGILKIKELGGRDDKSFEIIDFVAMAGDAPAQPAAKGPPKPKVEQGKKLSKEEKKQNKEKEKKTRVADAHELSILYKKEVNFPAWYNEVIKKAELIENYDISGCYILRPRSFYIWEKIQSFLDAKFKKLNVDNCYFPMFVKKEKLEKEKDHLEGFSPEVAWVTRSGQSEMEEPIAIRPTSETIMYPFFSKWIKSHRDLPLKINQWSNVVRWEFKHPTPFIRTREFLWQEGHTAHVDDKDATKMVMNILEAYATCYEELLAVPVVRGKKSKDETFAGANFSMTTEIYVPVSGRGIQGATSHNLGTNFAKMFDVWYEDNKGQKQEVWQTSWGLSTRSIGAMIMVHSDDMGLVLPPRVAQTQIVLIPIFKTGDDIDALNKKAQEIVDEIRDAGVRCDLDDRDKNPGFKYNFWEQRGTPIRLELGKKDFENKTVRCCIRHDGKKEDISMQGIGKVMADRLDSIHNEMYDKALQSRLNHVKEVDNWKDFMDAVAGRNICLAPWCNIQECEVEVKDRSKEESLAAMAEKGEEEAQLTGSAKTLCIPQEQKPLKAGAKCFACGKDATVTALWGRSY